MYSGLFHHQCWEFIYLDVCGCKSFEKRITTTILNKKTLFFYKLISILLLYCLDSHTAHNWSFMLILNTQIIVVLDRQYSSAWVFWAAESNIINNCDSLGVNRMISICIRRVKVENESNPQQKRSLHGINLNSSDFGFQNYSSYINKIGYMWHIDCLIINWN